MPLPHQCAPVWLLPPSDPGVADAKINRRSPAPPPPDLVFAPRSPLMHRLPPQCLSAGSSTSRTRELPSGCRRRSARSGLYLLLQLLQLYSPHAQIRPLWGGTLSSPLCARVRPRLPQATPDHEYHTHGCTRPMPEASVSIVNCPRLAGVLRRSVQLSTLMLPAGEVLCWFLR